MASHAQQQHVSMRSCVANLQEQQQQQQQQANMYATSCPAACAVLPVFGCSGCTISASLEALLTAVHMLAALRCWSCRRWSARDVEVVAGAWRRVEQADV
jgi:hypothetical protein